MQLIQSQSGWKFVLIALAVLNTVGPTSSLTAHEVSLLFEYYKDEGAALIVPGVAATIEPWEGGTLKASMSADTVSHASEYQTTDTDAVTGASEREQRWKSTIGYGQQAGFWTYQLGGYYSSEPDYESQALFWGIARDFFQRNTTLSITGNYGSDNISSTEDAAFSERASRYGGSLSVTQAISPIAIARFSFSYGFVDGYQANPYRTATRSSDTADFDNKEVLPEGRTRFAFFSQVNIYNVRYGGALHPAYRYYWDDWGISSHELEVKLLKYIVQNLIVHWVVRTYYQTEADFYHEQWTEPSGYMTSYAKYAAGYTFLTDVGSELSFDSERPGVWRAVVNGLRVRGGIGYYHRHADDNDGLIGHFSLSWRW